MTSSTPFLVLIMICGKSFLKSASGHQIKYSTHKLISIFNRMSIKFHSELGDFLRISTEISIHNVRDETAEFNLR